MLMMVMMLIAMVMWMEVVMTAKYSQISYLLPQSGKKQAQLVW